ncbi:MAG TPA: AtpZ/AtpI family protein [Gemmatimonadaceae bacterium]|nr:AtpZ/AtpI family protein [Gemmatimonadaceae bacterium]
MAGPLAGAGLQFAITIFLFLFLGQWLDRKWGTTPWLTVGGAFLGATAGFVSLYRTLMAAQKRDEEKRR